MKKLTDRLGMETLWGGIFGVVAILAAIVELILGGVDGASIAGMIKDIFGTLVAVMILVVAIRQAIPRKEKLNIDEKVLRSLENWEHINSNMISKHVYNEKENAYELFLRTDIKNFYVGTTEKKGTNSGRFVRLPMPKDGAYSQGKISLTFYLNEATFFDGMGLSYEERQREYAKLSSRFCGFIKEQYKDFLSAQPASGSNQQISVIIENPLKTDEDVQKLMNVLSSMYQAYLVSANIKVPK